MMNNLILFVEDNDEDFQAFSRIIKELGINENIVRTCDGDEALDYLYTRGKYENLTTVTRPAIIFLDLNLPGTNGLEVIKEIKQDDRLKNIPIIVLTTSSRLQDIETCYTYGANSYVTKPMGIKELRETIANCYQYWFKTVILPSH
jgi:CheY-like chemotaxis protein